MIEFESWTIKSDDTMLARQYDNRILLRIDGNFPLGYSWAALVKHDQNSDVWDLTPTDSGLECELTRDILAFAGWYKLQLRGIAADGTTRHTNVLNLIVPESVSGSGDWPQIPSEFAQIEERISALKLATEESVASAKAHAIDAQIAQSAAEQFANAAAESAASAEKDANRAEAAADHADHALSNVDWAYFDITDSGELVMIRADTDGDPQFALDAEGCLTAQFGG